MLQDYVTPLPLLLVAATHAACLIATVTLFIVPAARFPDWQIVRPAAMHWLAYIGSWALSLLLTWIWLFVGSARCDAQTQMFAGLTLILAFGAAATWSGVYIALLRRTALRWLGTEIRWQAKQKEISQEMSSFQEIKQGWDGAVRIRFQDGTVLKLDPYAQNAASFIQAMWQSIGEDITIDSSRGRDSRFPIAGRVHRLSKFACWAAVLVEVIMMLQVRSNPHHATARYPEYLRINGVDWYMTLSQMRIMEIAFIVFCLACLCGLTTGYYMEDVEN